MQKPPSWKGSEYASELASKVEDVKSVWISKVKDNLLLQKTIKKEPNELQNTEGATRGIL